METDRERNRSEFHLCSVPLCEGSFAVVISADVFHPVRRLQLSAAGNKPHTPHQPRCLTQSHCTSRISASAGNLMRGRGAPAMRLVREKNKKQKTGLFPNKFVFLLSTDLSHLREDDSDDSCAEKNPNVTRAIVINYLTSCRHSETSTCRRAPLILHRLLLSIGFVARHLR